MYNSINGGAGSDTIEFYNSHFVGLTGNQATIFYGSGDIIRFESAKGNYNEQVYVATSLDSDPDHVTVYSDGSDTYFQFKAGSNSDKVTYRVAGQDLVITTAVGTYVAMTSANFGFSLATTTDSGLTINLA